MIGLIQRPPSSAGASPARAAAAKTSSVSTGRASTDAGRSAPTAASLAPPASRNSAHGAHGPSAQDTDRTLGRRGFDHAHVLTAKLEAHRVTIRGERYGARVAIESAPVQALP